jgi:4-amino-4-deoxychorismate lyase
VTKRAAGVLGIGPVDPDGAVCTADDLGLTRGDGCFDATRAVFRPTADGTGLTCQVDHLDEHLHRFGRSCAALDLPELDEAAWRDLIDGLLADWDSAGEVMIKLMATRGREASHPDGPITGLVTLAPLSESALRQRRDGVAVITLDRGTRSDAFAAAPWLLGGVKTLSYGVNVAAMRTAVARGADDVVFTSSDGYLLEAPTSAVIWQRAGLLVSTPVGDTGILASITQQAIFTAAAAARWPAHYRLGTVDELLAADGAWLASSGRGVVEIRSVDGGPVARDPAATRRLVEFAGFADR